MVNEENAATPIGPVREVYHADGVEWLRDATLGPEDALVMSLPDVSAMKMAFDTWRRWFIDVAALANARCHPDSLVVFYQTDIKRDGRWVDKGHLVHLGADQAEAHCLWHKLLCRVPPGQTSFGRPAYGRWLAFSKRLQFEPAISTPDVLPDLGEMTWSRAMPMRAAVSTCAFLTKHTRCRRVIDPFCGRGTILAVANDCGLDALGVEISRKRARKARRLVVRDGVWVALASGR